MTREQCYFLLNHLNVAIGYAALKKMIDFYGDVSCLELPYDELIKESGIYLRIEQTEWFRKITDPEYREKEWERLLKSGVSYYSAEHEKYPARFSEIENPPFGIFVKGSLPEDSEKTAGIIGSRRCTSYGKEMAHYFGEMLSKAGIRIVSGMALGIDGFAGRGALLGTGGSYAVLGGGVDKTYPIENLDLYGQLTGIISERPLSYAGRPYDFPLRNRLISALSDVLLVIEAAENSGSLITVNYALSQGKTVFSLPGRVGDRMSNGTNRLLRDGAEVLTCPEDVLQYFGMNVSPDRMPKKKAVLTKEEKTVFDLISGSDCSMDALIERSGFPVSVLSEILLRLELKSLIKRDGIGGYRRV